MEKKTQNTILIVDDNAVNRTILRDLITILGYKPIEAENGEQALDRIFKKPHPDMILLDIMMPGIDGYDVLDKVKADKFLNLIPVIMITAVDDIESQIRCIEKGADDYIIKPFNSVLLRARINALLEKKELYDKEQQFNLWLADSYQKLQKAEAARDSLLHMIVHDLNNPICIIASQAQILEMLKKEGYPGDKIDLCANIIATSAKQMQTMAQHILDISGLENNSIQVQRELFNPAPIIEEIVTAYTPEVQLAGGVLTARLDANLMVSTDKGLLVRIIQNLLSNSLKYTREDTAPSIMVELKTQENQMILNITDNGRGIAKEHQESIFFQFFRENGRSSQNIKGLGLGLSFCRMAAERMNGTLVVHSAPDQGATFTLSLPLREQE